MAARIRLSELTADQRKALGVKAAASKSPGSKDYGDEVRCHACGEPIPGETAMNRHRDETGHRRYASNLGGEHGHAD